MLNFPRHRYCVSCLLSKLSSGPTARAVCGEHGHPELEALVGLLKRFFSFCCCCVIHHLFSAGGEAKEEYKREICRRRKQKLKKKVTRETMRRQWMKPGEQEGRGEGRRHRAAGDGASSIGFWSAGEGGQFNGVLVKAARPLLYTLPTLVYCSSSLRLHI